VPGASIEAVLFDLGHTLMDWTWDDDLLVAGHRAGLDAIGGGSETAAEALTARYLREAQLHDWEAVEEVEYPGLVRMMLADIGLDVDDGALVRFLEAEHAAWAPARKVGSMSEALLDALRDRGLKTGLVSNAWDPRWLLERDLEEMGLLSRLDAVVFSSEVGVRKPRPQIFEHVLEELGVDPSRSVFVGDRLEADIKGAADLGMTTVQAMWFRAEESDDGVEPDYRAYTMFDVLNIVERLLLAANIRARG
jgi:putative hydrolase of the HAD superfamily